MPLTATGRKVLASMRKQYGAKRGTRVFYASIKKGVPGSSKWHKVSVRKRRGRKRKRRKRKSRT